MGHIYTESLDFYADFHYIFGFHDSFEHQEEGLHVLHVKKEDELTLQLVGIMTVTCAYHLFDNMFKEEANKVCTDKISGFYHYD